MAILDMGTAPASTIGNPTTGNYFIFLDNENSDRLTTRDEFGVDTVYTAGVIPTELNDLSDVQVTTPLNGQVLKYKTGALAWLNQDEEPDLSKRVIVTTSNFSTTLGATVDSTIQYFLDGVVDCVGGSIEVPSGGINIAGFNPEISKLIDSTASFTMFTSPVGGSGNVVIDNVGMEVTGVTSQVYDLVGDTGLEVIELTRVNYNNCTSLGEIDTFRQGLESITGYFGGTPELTLTGTWVGGYFIDVSLVRNLTNAAFSLYKAGTAFSMASRFRSNQNCDLPALASYLDFAPANFTNPNTLQLTNMILTRNGVSDASDSNYTPNITKSDLASSWANNTGLPNTFVGGSNRVTTEVETTIVSTGVFVDLAGTYTASGLEHFDSPANGQLRHLADSPREFKVAIFGIIDGGSNDEVELKIVVWDDSASVFVDYKSVVRVINNLQGGRDVAYFNFTDNITLDTDDYVKIMVANISDTSNVTAELDTEFTIEKR